MLSSSTLTGNAFLLTGKSLSVDLNRVHSVSTLSFQSLMHSDRFSLAVLHFSSHSFSTGGGGAELEDWGGGSYQSQLYLTHRIDVTVIVFGSLSSVDNVVTSSVFRDSGRQPRPSILSRLPLISISPTSSCIKATDAHISLYISVSLTVVDSVVVRHSGPSSTNSLITAHSPKCVCNVGNHFQ